MITVVVVDSPLQVDFWHDRLGSVDGELIVVVEKWRAGNGLGILNAVRDLVARLQQGETIFVYSTAGKGCRLAPLPGAERNNKAAVNLPTLLDGRTATILEMVVRQTAKLKEPLKGHLAVFWADQLFLPSLDIAPPTHPISLFGLPDDQPWDGYGHYKLDPQGHATIFSKVADPSGVSLGSFVLKKEALQALLDEFSYELDHRQGYADSDPDFWVPLTQKRDARMERVYQKLGPNPVGMLEIGANGYWWDFGRLTTYYNNCMLLTCGDEEGEAMRKLFGPTHTPDHLICDGASRIEGCDIKSGTIRDSVLIGVKADHIEVRDAVIINTTAPKIYATESLVYNAIDEGTLHLPPRTVRTDAIHPTTKQRIPFWTTLDRDGKDDWDVRLPGNPLSYEELHNLNHYQSDTYAR